MNTTLLFDVWREVCRHLDIQESMANIAPLIQLHLPFDRLFLRELHMEQSILDTIGVGPYEPAELLPDSRTELTAHQLASLLDWCKQDRIAWSKGSSEEQTGWKAAVPESIQQEVMVAPLLDAGHVLGVMVMTARKYNHFTTEHKEIFASLREPVIASILNDCRLRELNTLREAAEADKQSLLARLGRHQLTDTIVGSQGGLRLVLERVELVSRSDVPVLILGDTGTGKEVIARAIHTGSPRHEGPFIRVNCGAIPPDLIDSQLFGHERGSFTGAINQHQGWFERAQGGTLFLDEVGELPLPAQIRLLRVLQDGYIERVGAHEPIKVSLRIVAATHCDLAEMIREGQFREDLWYRLAVFPIMLPPLHNRKEDIPELAHHFARKAAVRFGLPLCLPSEKDISLLISYPWPGNIRELAAVIDRAAILGNGKALDIETALGVSHDTRTNQEATPRQQQKPYSDELGSLEGVLRQHIEKALAQTRGRIDGPSGAARLLEVHPQTLRSKMRKLGIDWKQFYTT